MRSIRGIDAALRRIERRLGGEEKVFFLAVGPEGETLEEILIREAEREGQSME